MKSHKILPFPTLSIPKKVAETKIFDISDTEGASSKRKKSIPPEQSIVHTFLGDAALHHISEEELKKWSFHTEEQTNQAMIRAATKLHFHSIKNQSMNSRIRTRLAASENEKSKLQDRLKRYRDQLDKLKPNKDAEILELQLEKSCLEGVVASMENKVNKVSASNVALLVDKEVLEDEKLHGWVDEKK